MNRKQLASLAETCECDTLTMGEAAALMNMGRTTFMKLLRKHGMLLQTENRPSELMRRRGYMDFTTKAQKQGESEEKCFPVSLITYKGLAYVAAKKEKECLESMASTIDNKIKNKKTK